jgi:hypothetical protein
MVPNCHIRRRDPFSVPNVFRSQSGLSMSFLESGLQLDQTEDSAMGFNVLRMTHIHLQFIIIAVRKSAQVKQRHEIFQMFQIAVIVKLGCAAEPTIERK